LGLRVDDLVFRVYNTFVSAFNKHLKKITKHFLKYYKMLRDYGLGFRV